MADVIEVGTFDPEPGDTCSYYRQQKLKGRWSHAACGATALIRLKFTNEIPRPMTRNSDGSIEYADQASYPICKDCLIRITQSLVSALGYT
jgi:hypothetical protein